VGFYHLIVKKGDGEDIKREGWSDLKRRGERCMVYILDVV
jgi:hypothetical protein